MREIRFRAWDREGKKFRYFKLDDLVCYFIRFHTDGRIPEPFGDNLPMSLTSNRFDYQESTGLEDKYGKEIFEGDVLWHEDKDFQFNVFFQNGSFMYGFGNKSEAEFAHEGWHIDSKIIEHPELLK